MSILGFLAGSKKSDWQAAAPCDDEGTKAGVFRLLCLAAGFWAPGLFGFSLFLAAAFLLGLALFLSFFGAVGHLLHPAFFAGIFRGLELGLGHFLHEPSLADGEDVLDGPVESEGGGEVIAEEEEDERHEHEDALLHFIACFWRDLHLEEHCDRHEDGEDINGDAEDVADGVGLGEVIDPAEEGLVPEFYGVLEHVVEAEEDGDLGEHGEAAAHGVDAVCFVELHHLLIHLVRIIRVFFFERFDLGLELGHPLHGAGGLGVQRPHDGADDEGRHDDGPSPGPAFSAEEASKEVKEEI